MFLSILAELPTDALLIGLLVVLYRDNMKIRLDTGAWMFRELTSYMQGDREIVSTILTSKIEVASKYSKLSTQTLPPVPNG